MTNTQCGLLVGLLLGIAFAFEGFGDLLIVAFFGLLAVLVVKVVEGEIDVSDYIGRKDGT